MPEIAHIKINARDQNPSALCSDNWKLVKLGFKSMVRLRRHFWIPGHQITIPERHTSVTQAPPTPLTRWPALPDSRLSWRSASHSTTRNPSCSELPKSAPV